MNTVFKILVLCFLLVNPAWGGVDLELSSSQYLSQADGLSTDISGANQSISMSAWIKPESHTASMNIINKLLTTGNQRQYSFAYNTTSAAYRCNLSDNGVSTTNSAIGVTNAVDGTWQNIGCAYNDTDIRLYVNGLLDSNGSSNPFAYTSGIFNGTGLFIIGARQSGSIDSFFDGIVDDVCIWNIALTANEFLQIANSKLKGICRQIQPANLKLYCALDECNPNSVCSTYRCVPGSDVTATASPVAKASEVLSYPSNF